METLERRPRKVAVRVAKWLMAIAPVFLGAGYCGVSIFTAEVLTRSHLPSSEVFAINDPGEVEPRATPWSVRTEDGLTLRGWYHPSNNHRHLVVLIHGMRASWFEVAGLGRDLHRRGYDVLMFDLRGHGHSDPARITMGRRERADLRAALAWAKAHGFASDRIGWVGYSMGAATILMEGAQNPEIRLAVIDSPFGNLPELLDDQLTAA